MADIVPIKLERDPIISVVSELRFVAPSNTGAPMAQLLPGMLYAAMGNDFPKLEMLPGSEIPSHLRQIDPNAAAMPIAQLVGEPGAIMIGERWIAYVPSMPYRGWSRLKPELLTLWREALKTRITGDVDRFTLKYVNLIERPIGDDHLALTTVVASVSGQTLSVEPLSLRTEIKSQEMVAMVDLICQAKELAQQGTGRTGLIINVDAIFQGPFKRFEEVAPDLLEKLHSFEKATFFKLLTEEVVQSYGPSY